jgi:hypothetical protein
MAMAAQQPLLTTAEKLGIARNIYKQLDELGAALTQYPAVAEFRQLVQAYVREGGGTRPEDRRALTGTIKFPEALKVIVYSLPRVAGGRGARVVLEHRQPDYFRPARARAEHAHADE